jgi:putative ABC transport system permease protein
VPFSGREFLRSEAAGAHASPVAIVDQESARRLWPGQNAIGRRIRVAEPSSGRETAADSGKEYEVVGVVPAIRAGLFDRISMPRVYLPLGESVPATVFIVAHHSMTGQEASLLQAMRDRVHATDPAVPLLNLRTLRGQVQANPQLWLAEAWTNRFLSLGGLAVCLSLLGIYGANAYLVAQRTREFGIRIALGASRRDVLRLVFTAGGTSYLTGIVIGSVVALGAGRLLNSWLYGVSSYDPVTFIGVPLLLAAAMVASCFVPARRATSVDPAIALRHVYSGSDDESPPRPHR